LGGLEFEEMLSPRSYALILSLFMSIAGLAQDSSSAPRNASPSPTPVIRPKSSPERDAAISKGQELLFKKHDAKASVEEFKKAIKIDPLYEHGYMLLGLAQMQLGQWGDAQWAFEEAAKVEPGNAKAYLGIGSSLNEQRNYPAAQKALERGLDMDPESAEAHYELARTLAATGKWSAAGTHAQRAIDLNPDYPGPHIIMGNVYIENDEPEAALHEFQEYLRLNPQGALAPSAREMVGQLKKTLAQ